MNDRRFATAAGQAAIVFLACAGVLIGVSRLIAWGLLEPAFSGAVNRSTAVAAYVVAAGSALARFRTVYRARERRDP